MRKYIILILLIIYPYLHLYATSYAEPKKKKIYSANKEFYVVINPESNIHKIYKSNNKNTSIWNFQKKVWQSKWIISNDGKSVIWISWDYVREDDLDKPCIMVYKQYRKKKSYTFNQISKPRKYKKDEVGPIGSFWRVWVDSILEKKNELIINVSGGKKVFIYKIDGSIKISK